MLYIYRKIRMVKYLDGLRADFLFIYYTQQYNVSEKKILSWLLHQKSCGFDSIGNQVFWSTLNYIQCSVYVQKLVYLSHTLYYMKKIHKQISPHYSLVNAHQFEHYLAERRSIKILPFLNEFSLFYASNAGQKKQAQVSNCCIPFVIKQQNHS